LVIAKGIGSSVFTPTPLRGVYLLDRYISFRKYEIPIQQVYSSQWCRCKDTASYAFGNYQELSALNSTFEGKYRQNHQQQMRELKELIADWDNSEGNLILVTHYVIISGMLGYYPSSGELVITDKNLEVLDSIKTKY